ncbi:hypothetical protein BJ166DRAFT_586688 [Pestalotiopsis sp. NC0098]|nr:hypothetical protein BJ166DRAFT_586688 [Pestalotiopsis sp. NC0098]
MASLMATTDAASQPLEGRFLTGWWSETVPTLQYAIEARGWPISTGDGRHLLKAELIAMRGLKEMSFDWGVLTRVFPIASTLADLDQSAIGQYLEQLVGPGNATRSTKAEMITRIFEVVKQGNDVSRLVPLKNRKGDTIDVAPEEGVQTQRPRGADTPSDNMSVSSSPAHRRPRASGLFDQTQPSLPPLPPIHGARADQRSQVKKNENEVIKRTVEFAALIKDLLPGEFPEQSQSRDLEILQPHIESRIAAIEKQKSVLRHQIDEIAATLRGVTQAFEKLCMASDDLNSFLGQQGLRGSS